MEAKSRDLLKRESLVSRCLHRISKELYYSNDLCNGGKRVLNLSNRKGIGASEDLDSYKPHKYNSVANPPCCSQPLTQNQSASVAGRAKKRSAHGSLRSSWRNPLCFHSSDRLLSLSFPHPSRAIDQQTLWNRLLPWGWQRWIDKVGSKIGMCTKTKEVILPTWDKRIFRFRHKFSLAVHALLSHAYHQVVDLRSRARNLLIIKIDSAFHGSIHNSEVRLQKAPARGRW